MAKYGNAGGNNSNQNERGYATTLKTNPFVKLGGDLDRIVQGSNDFGESVGVNYENGTLVDGILCKTQPRKGKGIHYKVFSWQDAPVVQDENLTTDDLPQIMTYTPNNGDPINYDILAARLEGDEDAGYGDDAALYDVDHDGDTPVLAGVDESESEPISLGMVFQDDLGDADSRFTVWEGSSKYGPCSSAKTTVSILTVSGTEGVLSKDEQFGWSADGLTLRPELEGVTVTYRKEKKQSDRSDNTFHHPAWVAADGNLILANNEGNSESSSGEKAAVADGGEEVADDDGGASGDNSPGVQEFIDTCASLELDTEPAILGLLDDMVDDDDYDLTAGEVDDRDDLVAQVQAEV